MVKTLLTIFFLFPALITFAQTFTSSNLPIVLITTDAHPETGHRYEIPDDPKILATMKVIFRPDSSRNFLTDQDSTRFINYDGRIKIELRGSTSQMLPKKPYGLTTLQNDNATNNNVSLLGMPKENDWILNSLPYDPSLIRDFLSYELSRDMGNYAARGRYCEVVINDEYMGLYILMEKLKIDAERIDIEKLSENDSTEALISGGYIIKSDKIAHGEQVAWTMYNDIGSGVNFVYESPKSSDITSAQQEYISDQFHQFQELIASHDSSITTGYPSIIDVPSFVDFMIINEITSNVDAYEFSTYFHKDRNGKLRAGPVWDFNLTYGNDLFFWGFDRSHADGWQFDNGDNIGAPFWKDLYEDQTFRCNLAKRWHEITAPGKPLSMENISLKIDHLVPYISEAMEREEERWNSIGDHTEKITSIKEWLASRITWINENISDYESCVHPELPPLVISKIHYNPVIAEGKASNDLEFIEIINNSDDPVNLAGIYLREPGLNYQFSSSQIVGPRQPVHLASNAIAFEEFYKVAPMGQFTRKLSNKSHNLILADAFGNIIDQVAYADTAPWPRDADGGGYYLFLNDINADNNDPKNWSSSDFTVNVKIPNPVQKSIDVFPNPSSSLLFINSKVSMISTVEIMDIFGIEILKSNNIFSDNFSVDISSLQPNPYVLKVTKEDGSTSVSRIVKY